MDNIKKRNSNIELLRIISIFFIIISHFCVHSGFPIFSFNNVNINMFLVQILHLGCIGNHIFIIITGYFLINKKFDIKKIIKLLIEMTFYSIIIGIICMSFNPNLRSLKNIIKSVFPIFWGNWFIVYYIILYTIFPFINKFIDAIDRNEYNKILIILSFLMIFIPSITSNAWNFNEHSLFVLDYLIGAYISKYVSMENLKKKKVGMKLFFCFIVYIIISILLIYFSKILNIEAFLRFISFIIGTNYSIGSYIFAVLLVLYFLSLKDFSSSIINYCAGSVLGIYLIHEHFLVRDILWKDIFCSVNYIENSYFIFIMLIKSFIVFSVCLIIDIIRRAIFGKIENISVKKIEESLNKLIVFNAKRK